MQGDLQKLPPGFPRSAVPQPPFPPLALTMGQMHALMPTQSLQPTQHLEYKVQLAGVVLFWNYSVAMRRFRKTSVHLQCQACEGGNYHLSFL